VATAPIASGERELCSREPIAGGLRNPLRVPFTIEATLGALLYDRAARAAWRDSPRAPPFDALDAEALEEAAGAVRAMVRERRHRGTGRLAELFPLAIEAWRRLHPEDTELDELVARFLASPSAAAWREGPGVEAGACLEACFAAFLLADGISDAVTCEEELLSASLRTLAVTPAPSFRPPLGVRRGPGGWFAVSGAEPPILHVANRQGYLRGPVTPLIISLLDGVSTGQAAARHGVTGGAAAAVTERLHEMGLLARRDNRG
jgi:hypothetical protein